MKRRACGFIGLAVWAVLVYLTWRHLGGGEGLTRNLARNTALGLLAPWGIYCLVLLFRVPKRPLGTSENRELRSPPDEPARAGRQELAGTPETSQDRFPQAERTIKYLRWTALALLVFGVAWPLGLPLYVWISRGSLDKHMSDGEAMLLFVPLVTAIIGFFLAAVAARGIQLASRKPVVIAASLAFLVLGVDLAIWKAYYESEKRSEAHRAEWEAKRAERVERDRKLSLILDAVLPHAQFSGMVKQTEPLRPPIVVFAREEDSGRFTPDPYGTKLWSPGGDEAAWQACNVVLIRETDRKVVGRWHRDPTDPGFSPLTDPNLFVYGPSDKGIADAVAVQLTVCVVSWPDKRVLLVKSFVGYPPRNAAWIRHSAPPDGKEDAEKKIEQFLAKAVTEIVHDAPDPTFDQSIREAIPDARTIGPPEDTPPPPTSGRG